MNRRKTSSILCLLLIGIVFFQCTSTRSTQNFQSEDLTIKQISKHTFIHVSYLNFNGNKVACNGLIFIDQKEAVIFDTPTEDSIAQVLITWVEQKLDCKIKAVVVNHFHDDCLGGLGAFHQQGIPSYANQATIELAQKDSVVVPQNGFEGQQELIIGSQKVINTYFGPAHAMDNIVSWIPSEKTLFGGCMVKSVGANKGFVGHGDVKEWPKTVAKVKAQYPELKVAIPGHGDHGGVALLDYTIKLFQ